VTPLRRTLPRALAITTAVLLVPAACGDDEASPITSTPTATTGDGCDDGAVVTGRPLRIATTVAPITSIVANVAGGTATVITGVVPEGANSHTFEPAPSDAVTLSTADVVFINGLVLEEPTKDLALANLAPGATVCELGTRILPRDQWIFDFSFPEEGGKPNPHLWTNPPMALEYAEIVRDHLTRRDPANAVTYRTNFDAFAAKINALDAAVVEATATVPEAQRLLLTYHDAYAYFAERYGWTVIGAIEPSSFDEPSPRDVADIIEQVRATGVPAIFGSEVFPSPVLAQIGAETGVRYIDVLRDDDLLGGPGDPEHSWLGLMRFNFVTMVEALGGDASALRALDVSDVAPDTATYPQ
jgi:ABC-type Zn uptake system ZnuABC Zn-binding protein ZnuA